MKFGHRILLDIVGSLIYLGLAVVAFGGVARFFAHPALIALAVLTIVIAVIAVFAGGNLSRGVREDSANRWVLIPFGVIGLLSAFVPPLTDRLGFWVLDGETLRWIGVVLYVAGCTLRLWPVFVLGDRFSGLVAIQPGHALVTTGIYGVIRNPSYLGLLVTMLGWSLAFRSAIGVLLMALMLVPLVARIRAEEKLLGEQFGVEYDAYRARTWRLFPGLY
jgi:protein-S-isoprenylcysteine O-methyltransferase Ste14